MMTINKKSEVKEVIFHWKEGSSSLSKEIEAGKYNCNSLIEADRMLTRWARQAPKGGDYEKTKFTVKWENGDEYDGQYELVHISLESPSLGRHMKEFISNILEAGKNLSSEEKKEYRRFLNELDFGFERIGA